MKLIKPIMLGAVAIPAVLGFTSCQNTTIQLEQIGRYESGIFAESAAEIVSFDKVSNRVFVINAENATVDVLGLDDPTSPTLQATIDATALGGGANSVDTYNGIVAVAIEGDSKQDPGLVAFYDAQTLALIDQVTVGALPDMVTFTPDGKYVLAANEGEPSDDYKIDPEGSVSIINIASGVVETADFTAFNGQADALRDAGVRIFGPGASVAQDLEPEYITVSKDSKTAYVALQENNALAKVDIKTATVTDILPLGFKDHSLLENGLDASDKDDLVNIQNWPVFGIYQPDTIASYDVFGKTFIVTANEGDGREYIFETATEEECLAQGGLEFDDEECLAFIDEARIKDLDLDPTVFTDATIQDNENLGRLKVVTELGDADGDGLYEELYTFGARSFSIFDENGNLVFDSGRDFEVITSNLYGFDFNNDNDANDSDGRSDAKGPEPEAVAIGKIAGKTYAFIGLERMGGIMVYDITNPYKGQFIEYVNNRDLSVEPQEGVDAGDLGPEGFEFVAAKDSPNGKPLLIVGSEVSGTTTVYQINVSAM